MSELGILVAILALDVLISLLMAAYVAEIRRILVQTKSKAGKAVKFGGLLSIVEAGLWFWYSAYTGVWIFAAIAGIPMLIRYAANFGARGVEV